MFTPCIPIGIVSSYSAAVTDAFSEPSVGMLVLFADNTIVIGVPRAMSTVVEFPPGSVIFAVAVIVTVPVVVLAVKFTSEYPVALVKP